jgi:hypothetical protein
MKNVNNKGSILAISIIFIFIFTLLGMFAMRLVILQNETSDSELYYTRAHFAALYGSELAFWRIMQWENIPTNSAFLNTDGRKFLAEDSNCFNWHGGKWYPLTGYANTDITNRFSDSASASDRSGIALECEVQEEVPDSNDGFIVSTADTNTGKRFATAKYYVINTIATMYGDAVAKTGEIAQANDQMHFVIVYSSGSHGARPLDAIAADTIIGYPMIPGLRDLTEDFVVNVTTTNAPYIVSAPRRSVVTGEVVPIFRYYIRGKRESG